MLILGLSPTSRDATACLFDDYRLLAAVSQERMTRRKSDGGGVPHEAIAECLTIAGVRREAVDAVVTNRSRFSESYYTHYTGYRWVKAKLRTALGIPKTKYLDAECNYYKRTDTLAMFDAKHFLVDHGFRTGTDLSFCNHHLAHALPCLFHTDWPEALLYTAGLPVLVNTSFNVHEEPIINSPDECAKALADKRIDFVVTERGVYGLAG